MGRRRNPWRWSTKGPHKVTVYERDDRPGGGLYLRVWDPGAGRHRRRALGHRDEKRARIDAERLHLALVEGAKLEPEAVTLGRIFDAYKRHRTPRKVATEQQNDGRRFKLFEVYFGRDKDPNKISLREWESFIDLRGFGAIDSHGNTLPEKQRRKVRSRTVEADLLWLRWVLNWAVKWRVGDGYLLNSNPVRGFETPEVKNVRRPVASTDRYETVRAKSDDVTMEIRWRGKRETVRSYLSELLDIAYGTGRRLSAICSLRYEDLRLDEGPHGSIRWPADTDKQGRETMVPISPLVRAALDRVLRDRPGSVRFRSFPRPRTRRRRPRDSSPMRGSGRRRNSQRWGRSREAYGTPTGVGGRRPGNTFLTPTWPPLAGGATRPRSVRCTSRPIRRRCSGSCSKGLNCVRRSERRLHDAGCSGVRSGVR